MEIFFRFVEENLVSSLCFLSATCCLFFTWLLKKDFFRPVNIYVFTQTLTLGIAYLKLDKAMTDFKGLTWMVWAGALFSFVAGGLVYSFVARKTPGTEPKGITENFKNYNWNKHFIISLILILVFLLSVFYVIYKVGNLIVFTDDPGKWTSASTDLGYAGLGLASSPLVVLFLSILAFKAPKKIHRILSFILMLLIPLLSLLAYPSRTVFFMSAAFIIIAWNFFKQRIKIRTIVLAIFLGIVFFISVGSVRNQYGGGTIENMALEKVIELPYKYIANNFWNLDYSLNPASDKEIHPHTYGIAFISYIVEVFRIPGSLRQSLGFDSILNESVQKVPGYNTINYLWEVYKDFGVFGVVLFPFVVSFIFSYLYEKMKSKNTVTLSMLIVMFTFYIGWSFFAAGFVSPTFWLWIYLIFILTKLCENKKVLRADA